jgi:hypothetical protein
MQLTIVGPRRNDPQYDVHTASCRDLQRIENRSLAPHMNCKAATQADAIDYVYPPKQFECESGEYAADFRFYPCTHGLPAA